MPRALMAVEGYHRHIMSLQGLAALAAGRSIRWDYQVSSRDWHACIRRRDGLSAKLLELCDHLYSASGGHEQLTTIITADAAWISQMFAVQWRHRWATHPPCCPENVAVFIGVVDHIDWDWFANKYRNEVGSWIGHYFDVYATAVFSDFPECRRPFMDMLTRVYKNPRLGWREYTITKSLCTANVPECVYEHIKQLDNHFVEHVARMKDDKEVPMCPCPFCGKPEEVD